MMDRKIAPPEIMKKLTHNPSDRPRLTPMQALDALQKHLRLDARQAAEWMNVVREARR
jgi:hypothetical protein